LGGFPIDFQNDRLFLVVALARNVRGPCSNY